MNKKASSNNAPDFVVMISANAEWHTVKALFPGPSMDASPYGEWFIHSYDKYEEIKKPIVLMHGGWGKVAAAGSTQYAIDQWHPRLIINLGTCGGFAGDIERNQIVLAEKTVIYDIYEQMGDPIAHIQHYVSNLDTSWSEGSLPHDVIRSVLVSGDRDLFWKDIPSLKSTYGAVAGDWESGAIAWVAHKNHTQCFILRGVTDLVGENGGDAYDGKVDYYHQNTRIIMKVLIESLPQWVLKYCRFYSG